MLDTEVRIKVMIALAGDAFLSPKIKRVMSIYKHACKFYPSVTNARLIFPSTIDPAPQNNISRPCVCNTQTPGREKGQENNDARSKTKKNARDSRAKPQCFEGENCVTTLVKPQDLAISLYLTRTFCYFSPRKNDKSLFLVDERKRKIKFPLCFVRF